ncbi:killer toxin resistant protein [Mucor circinelloides]
MNLTELPPEVIVGILNHIDSIRDLAQCRRISRALNIIAEKEMFCRKIVLQGDAKITQFNKHLMKKPTYKHNIKFITAMSSCYNDYDKSSEKASLELLGLAFTPGMVEFRGRQPYESFFDTMVNIKQESASEFKHLETIPITENSGALRAYCLAANEFKQTLQEIQITNVLDSFHLFESLIHLDKFICLTRLTIFGSVINIIDLHCLLLKCPQLLELEITTIENFGPESFQTMSTFQVNQWFSSLDDKGRPSLKKLKFNVAGSFTELLEYLKLKYPNVENLSGNLHLGQMMNDYPCSLSLSRVIEAVEHIPDCCLNFSFYCYREDIFDEVSIYPNYNHRTHSFSSIYSDKSTRVFASFHSKYYFSEFNSH